MGQHTRSESEEFLAEADKEQAQATLSRLRGIASVCVQVGLRDFEGQLTNSGWAHLMGSTEPTPE